MPAIMSVLGPQLQQKCHTAQPWTSPLTALNINNLAGLIHLPCVF
jgi:hypothetical protein